jgi:hypothetical protein
VDIDAVTAFVASPQNWKFGLVLLAGLILRSIMRSPS